MDAFAVDQIRKQIYADYKRYIVVETYAASLSSLYPRAYNTHVFLSGHRTNALPTHVRVKTMRLLLEMLEVWSVVMVMIWSVVMVTTSVIICSDGVW